MNCKNCKNQRCFLSGNNHEMSFECSTYVGKTNADRIRGMSDEELAEFEIERMCCPHGKHGCKENNLTCDNCEQCWLDWMKQEVKDD